MKKEKTYRFFYHYYKQYKCMSVHFKGKCYKTKNVICKGVETETKWNEKSQPNLVVQGFASKLDIRDDRIIIC